MTTDQRVVSLLPSATEIVAGVGCLGRLVGRSHECDFPPGVEALPVCTRPRLALDGTSAEIDAQVKGAVRDAVKEAAAIYEVLADALGACAPDVIVTQDQCEVCAVSLADVEAAVENWAGRPVTLVSLAPMRLTDVYGDVGRVADALGVADAGEILVGDMRGRVDAVAGRARTLDAKPGVACIEWTEPLMAAGNWVPEMVETAGGRDLFGKAGANAPGLEWVALIEADPDVIVVMPCGFGLERTTAEARALAARPGWGGLKAVKAGRVFATDASSYFNRPGPRLADSVEILAEVLHPGTFDFGHEGKGWVKVGA